MHIPELMSPAEVARAFGVDSKTVTRWAEDGKIEYILTLGGHRRYFKSDIVALLKRRPVRDS